jgi:hypothetical protein
VLSAQSAESWHALRTSSSNLHYPFREASLAYTHFHSPSQSRESSPEAYARVNVTPKPFV